MLINGYEIKRVNKEEILYIYMDLNSEFAYLNKKNKRNIKRNIKKYIKSNKIKFKGSLVAIMVGGVMVGTIMLNNLKKSNINTVDNSSKIVAILDNNPNHYIDELLIDNEVIMEEVKDDKINLIDDDINNIEIPKEKNESKKEESIKDEDSVSESIDTHVDNNTYVTLYRKNGSIIKIELEEYVIGVVGAEMPASFNSEALKAQAIVARTYTLKALESNKKLTDNNSTQNYKDNDELKQMWGISYDTYYNKVKNAVNSTKGIYLTYNGEIIDAVYHSTSNGYTEDSVNVWGNKKPYLKSVNSPYDSTNKSFQVTTFYSYEDISNKLDNLVNQDTEFNILGRNESNRVELIELNGINYSGTKFRNLLGLRSTDFIIEKVDNGINITTKGYGHGVGMSQYGANGMANNGSNYRDILIHYYSGVSLSSL